MVAASVVSGADPSRVMRLKQLYGTVKLTDLAPNQRLVHSLSC